MWDFRVYHPNYHNKSIISTTADTLPTARMQNLVAKTTEHYIPVIHMQNLLTCTVNDQIRHATNIAIKILPSNNLCY